MKMTWLYDDSFSPILGPPRRLSRQLQQIIDDHTRRRPDDSSMLLLRRTPVSARSDGNQRRRKKTVTFVTSACLLFVHHRILLTSSLSIFPCMWTSFSSCQTSCYRRLLPPTTGTPLIWKDWRSDVTTTGILEAVAGGDSGSESGSGDTRGGFDGGIPVSVMESETSSAETFDSGLAALSVDRSSDSDHIAQTDDSQILNECPPKSSSLSPLPSSSDVPFFASQPIHVFPTKKEEERQKLNHNTTTASKSQNQRMTRRTSFRYGLVLFSGTSLAVVAGRESERMHKLQQEAEAAEKARQRLSLFPQPVLKKQPVAPSKSTSASTPLKPLASERQLSTISSTSTKTKFSQPTPAKSLPGSSSKTSTVVDVGRLERINLTQVAKETNINITLGCKAGCLEIDSKNFTKVRKPKPSKWLPSFLAPSPQVVKEISQSELFIAATVAGAVTESFRTTILYPIQTIKTRIQSDPHKYLRKQPPLVEQVTSLGTNVKKHVQEGDLYAGIAPTLLVSVPATGIYYGARDVTKRMLSMVPMISDVWVAVLGALVADVVSLCFRTPADALAVRKQAQNATVGDWMGDSLQRLPMIIITDLPYLLSKVVLNKVFIQGQLSVGEYAELAVVTAIIAAFLTTPFDVVRTRLLLDDTLDGILDEETQEYYEADNQNRTVTAEGLGATITDHDDAQHGIMTDIGETAKYAGRGVLSTMLQVAREGEGGVSNLFAGWLERVLYLGIGRAWLEPVQLVGYIGIRDAVLLEWF